MGLKYSGGADVGIGKAFIALGFNEPHKKPQIVSFNCLDLYRKPPGFAERQCKPGA